MYSKTLTLIVSSTCLKTLDPVGGAGRETNKGTVHGLSATPGSARLPLCLNLGWTFSLEDYEDGAVSIDLVFSHCSKLVSQKKKHQNLCYFAETKFSSAKNTKLGQFQNVP